VENTIVDQQKMVCRPFAALGYEVFGELDNYPADSKRIYLCKMLT
jgi:hypothetical protein